jgi:hypothetical protein
MEKEKDALSGFSTKILNHLQSAIPVPVLHANKTSHEPTNMFRSSTELDETEVMDYTHSEHAMQMFVWRQILDSSFRLVQILFSRHL